MRTAVGTDTARPAGATEEDSAVIDKNFLQPQRINSVTGVAEEYFVAAGDSSRLNQPRILA